MITIIAGTNRPSSLTLKFAANYFKLIEKKYPDVQLLSLADIPVTTFLGDIYNHSSKPDELKQIQDNYFITASKFIFILPEYNGSLPGILKLLIDSMDPKLAFKDKKASLIGVASGRAGNLRGLDHLSAILMHMQVKVHPFLLPVSKAQNEMDDGIFKESTLRVVEDHIRKTLEF